MHHKNTYIYTLKSWIVLPPKAPSVQSLKSKNPKNRDALEWPARFVMLFPIGSSDGKTKDSDGQKGRL